MMTNKEKFLALVSDEATPTLRNTKRRIRNRAMLKASQKIAIRVLARLRELEWTQKDLAERLEVSPQQVSKIVSGKENLTLQTLVQLQEILDIELLVSHEPRQTVSTE
ncbi:MAG: helix-turn-helix transcriptional regulator [Bernardetiaceae bacterium]|nr:helix-turn-helix transcriptional regulator [Bernardetiaceae bacterium]